MRQRSKNYAEDLAVRCQELADVLIPAIRYRAETCGYAIGVHGSLRRDIDLIAVPWREGAVDAPGLIERVLTVVKAIHGESGLDAQLLIQGPTEKPCGRLAWAIHLSPELGAGPYLDISVFLPRSE